MMPEQNEPRQELAGAQSSEPLGELVPPTADPRQLARPVADIWREGLLFHNFSRYLEQRDGQRVDRLESILEKGLLAPSEVPGVPNFRNVPITVSGLSVSYESLVFLHQFSEQRDSWLYTMVRRDSCTLIFDSALPVIDIPSMVRREPNWIVLCPDEVYVERTVPLHYLRGLAVHEKTVPEVCERFGERIAALSLALYTHQGIEF